MLDLEPVLEAADAVEQLAASRTGWPSPTGRHLGRDPERAVERPAARRRGRAARGPAPGRRPPARPRPLAASRAWGRRRRRRTPARDRWSGPRRGCAPRRARRRLARARSRARGGTARPRPCGRSSRRRRRSPRTPSRVLGGERLERARKRALGVPRGHDHAGASVIRGTLCRRYTAARADRPDPRLLLAGGARGARSASCPGSGAALTRRGHEVVHFSSAWERRSRDGGRGRDGPPAALFRGRVPPRGRLRAPAALRTCCCATSTPSTRSVATTPWPRSARPASARRRRTVFTDLGLPTRSYWQHQGRREARAVDKVVARVRRLQRHVAAARSITWRGNTAATTAWSCPAASTWTRSPRRPAARSASPRSCSRARSTFPARRCRCCSRPCRSSRAAEPDVQLWLSGPGDADRAPRGAPQPRRASAREALGLGEADRQHERYGRAWVTCLPSRYDSFGMVLVESLACGTPLVTTTQGAPAGARGGGRHRRALPARRPGGPGARAACAHSSSRGGRRPSRPAGARRSASTGTAGSRRSCERLYASALTCPGARHRGRADTWAAGSSGRCRRRAGRCAPLVRERAGPPRRRADGRRTWLDDDAAGARRCEGVDTVVHLAGENEVVAAQRPGVRARRRRCWPPSAWSRRSRPPGSGVSSTCRPCTSTASGCRAGRR